MKPVVTVGKANLYHAGCLDWLAARPANSFHGVVTHHTGWWSTPRRSRQSCGRARVEATTLLPKLVPGAHVLVASNPLVSYLVAQSVVGAGFERRGEVIRLVMTMRVARGGWSITAQAGNFSKMKARGCVYPPNEARGWEAARRSERWIR